MVYLSEAVEYRSMFQNIEDALIGAIENPEKMFVVTEYHNRSKAVPGQEDEVREEMTSDAELGVTPSDVIDFLQEVCEERRKFETAVEKAECKGTYSIKALRESVKTQNRLTCVTDRLMRLSPSKTERMETGYMLNKKGEQVTYQYPVVVEKKLDFDKKEMIARSRQANDEMSRLSRQLVELEKDTVVDYTPIYDAGEMVLELIHQFKRRREAQ